MFCFGMLVKEKNAKLSNTKPLFGNGSGGGYEDEELCNGSKTYQGDATQHPYVSPYYQVSSCNIRCIVCRFIVSDTFQ